jgi:hypothetical protein
MHRALLSIRERLDRAGVLLSGLCLVHCLLGLVIVSALGLGGGVLLAPEVHRIGLALAVLIGLIALGAGFVRHGAPLPLVLGAAGLALMGAALAVGHGPGEALLTICGVALVASAHLWNLRRAQ